MRHRTQGEDGVKIRRTGLTHEPNRHMAILVGSTFRIRGCSPRAEALPKSGAKGS